MANKSIIDIQVNDEAFTRFNQAFKAYSKDLEQQPASYKRLQQAVSALNQDFSSQSRKARIEFSAVHKAADEIRGDLERLAKSQTNFTRSVTKSGKAMHGLVGGVKHLGKGLATLARFGATLGGITGGIGLGAALFGLPTLAFSAMRTGIRSRQLGMTSGQLNAFNVHMSNLFSSPEGYLSSIVQAQHNPTGATGLSLLTGLSLDKIGRMNAAKLGVLAAEKMHAFAKEHNNEYLQTWLQAYKLGGVFNVPEAQLLARTPLKQIQGYGAAATSPREAKALGFSPNAAVAEARFAMAMKRAGVLIETDLVRHLSNLGPRLAQLSHAVAGSIVTLVNDVFTPGNIKALTAGIVDVTHGLEELGRLLHDINPHETHHPGIGGKHPSLAHVRHMDTSAAVAVTLLFPHEAHHAGLGGKHPGLAHVHPANEAVPIHVGGRHPPALVPQPVQAPDFLGGWQQPLIYPQTGRPVQQLLQEVRNILSFLEQRANARPPLKTSSANVGGNPAMNTYMAAGQ